MTDSVRDMDKEIATAGRVMADLLASTLMPSSGSWTSARATYIWEHNALCWLHRNRDLIPSMNDWTAHLLREGYPFTPFIDVHGSARPAGFLWNSTMEPR